MDNEITSRLIEIVAHMMKLCPFSEKNGFGSQEYVDYFWYRKMFSPYIDEYLSEYLSELRVSAEVIDSPNSVKKGCFIRRELLTVDVFCRLYGSKADYGKVTDSELRDEMTGFLKTKCTTFMPNGSLSSGFDRQCGLVFLGTESITFVDEGLKDWYIDKIYVDARSFVKYLERVHALRIMMTRLFPSIEKDRHHNDDSISYDSEAAPSERTRRTLRLKTLCDAIRKVSGTDRDSLTNTIYAYLITWFRCGTNSNIVLCNENERFFVVSRLMDRFFRNSLAERTDYSRFNGDFFNPKTDTYTITNGDESLEYTDRSLTTYFNVGPTDGKDTWFGTNNRTSDDIVSDGTDKLHFATAKGEISPANGLANTFGLTNGSYQNDVVGLYGYVVSVDPLLKRADGSTIKPSDVKRREYMMKSGDTLSIQRFCTIAMKGFDNTWTAYDKFCDYIDYCYRSNVDSLVDYADGVYDTLVKAGYIKDESL